MTSLRVGAMLTRRCVVHPIGQEDVCLTGLGCAPVGGEHQLASIRAEHREAVELRVPGHLLEAGSIDVDQIQVEVAATRVAQVRAEDDLSSVGVKKWRE